MYYCLKISGSSVMMSRSMHKVMIQQYSLLSHVLVFKVLVVFCVCLMLFAHIGTVDL